MSSELAWDSSTRTGGKDATEGVIQGRYALSVGMPKTVPPDGWVWTPLSSVARLETGHTPSRKHPEYWGGDIPWIGIRDATSNHGSTIWGTNQYTNELGIKNSSARILPVNTVCLSRTASVGYVVVMGVPMATSQDFVNWVCGSALDYRYLKYILLAEHDTLLRFASGTTHQTIYFPEAKAFHVCLPSLKVQNAISDLLQSLDDRIALLRKTNLTLETIAQALFKSWFIDFDPVRAKQEGREPEGMDEATAALFPDTFEDSELGLVPKGWRVQHLGDLCTLQKGCSYKGDGLSDNEGAYMFNLGCFNAPRVYATEKIKRYTGEYRERHAVGAGDLIVANTDMTQERAILGRPLIVPNGYEPGFISHHVFKVEPNSDRPCGLTKYLFFAFLQSTFRERVVGYATGTTVLALPKDAFQKHQLVIPDDVVLGKFLGIADLVFSSIERNLQKIETLATLRDTLLPRLISGQLRLPDAEALVEEAAA